MNYLVEDFMNRQIQHRHTSRSVILICGIIISFTSFALIQNHSSLGDVDDLISLNPMDYPSDLQTDKLAKTSNTCMIEKDPSTKELKDSNNPQVHFNFLTSFLEVESSSSKNEHKEDEASPRGLIARLGSMYNIFSAK